MTIERLRAERLRIPLAKPYKLAFGDVTHFDTILVCVEIDGREGVGEATILNGYTDETIEESWALARELAASVGRLPLAIAKERLANVWTTAPFTATAFLTAIEMAEGHPLLAVAAPKAVPLLFGLNATDPAGIEHEMEQAFAAGFGTLKIKVGFSVQPDLDRVRLIQRLNAGRMRLRVDANQGYSAEDGARFASALSPDSIELLEQPCHAKDWDAAAAVAKVTRVPLMLDESIYGLADIDRAARIGASLVKLKLMKLGSLTALAEGLDRIRALGMRPVLGNGVASDIGCWMEACVAAARIDNAGEMNGYLRQREPLAADPIRVAGGAMQLAPDARPSLAEIRVRRCTVATCHPAERAEERVC